MNPRVYEKLLNIGKQLTAQRDIHKLLDMIVSEAMEITHCDGGTLYLYEEGRLCFKIMRTVSKGFVRGGLGDPIDLPSVKVTEHNICSYALIHGEMQNIPDVYCSDKFDFSGPRNYDQLIGYRTKSMMAIPLEDNKGQSVGVLQLINAMNEQGEIIPFDQSFEWVFDSIASQAAIAVTNMKYTEEVERLFFSLVEVLTTAIDERSHYNADHTRGVVTLTVEFISYINQMYQMGETQINFDAHDEKQIEVASWLHDVGKIITPLEIMDKESRLGMGKSELDMRFEMLYYMERCRFLEGETDQAQWETMTEKLRDARDFIVRINTGPLTDEDVAQVHELAKRRSCYDGKAVAWITPLEYEQLTIRHGTLTAAERKIMENHVVMTEKLLSKINFSKEYADVPQIAGSHHERPNGKGYPKGISGEEMPLGARILQLMDIFEALTSSSRPYKKPTSQKDAFAILTDMAKNDDIDGELLRLLKRKYEID